MTLMQVQHCSELSGALLAIPPSTPFLLRCHECQYKSKSYVFIRDGLEVVFSSESCGVTRSIFESMLPRIAVLHVTRFQLAII